MAHGKTCGCEACNKKRGFVIVHRNESGEVVEAGAPFTNEQDANERAATLLRTINFFPGDSLHMEVNKDQKRKAINRSA
jgi:hypothetical protein